MTVPYFHNSNCIAVVSSHRGGTTNKNNKVNLSGDVTSVKTNKVTKNSGKAVVTLVARRNYYNHVWPNDLIDIYFDAGDGKGYIRTFFGYVDTISRTEETRDDGTFSTTFELGCSDFQKAFEKTNLICRPSLEGRNDLVDQAYGGNNLEGTAMRLKGIRIYGGPAAIIESLANTAMGASDQFKLPANYLSESDITISRQNRLNRLKAFLTDDIKNAFAKIMGSSVDEYKESGSIFEGTFEKIKIENNKEKDTQKREEKRNLELKLKEGEAVLAAYLTVKRNINNKSPNMLDLVDFSFIETLCLDGFTFDTAIWTNDDINVAQTMFANCNGDLNELIFDLRPVLYSARGNSDACVGKGLNTNFNTYYSTDKDTNGYNHGLTGDPDGSGINSIELTSTVEAVQYVPAIVLREYPFSTDAFWDLDGVYVMDFTEENNISKIPLGPVFSKGPFNSDKPGRAFYDYSTIGLNKGIAVQEAVMDTNDAAIPRKHLDVYPLKDSEIISTKLSRSDAEVFNIIDVIPNDAPIQYANKMNVRDILPIINATSLSRNGLRYHEVTTNFLRFTNDKKTKENIHDHVSNARFAVIRWATLTDHWYQHNAEYLSGTITCIGSPMIRVGYRLDLVDRNESYYVEGVSHTWSYQGSFRTDLQVSRGQNNQNFPTYIEPEIEINNNPRTTVPLPTNNFVNTFEFDKQLITNYTDEQEKAAKQQQIKKDRKSSGKSDRSSNGRLADYFLVKDNKSTLTAWNGDLSEEIFEDPDENNDYNQNQSDIAATENTNTGESTPTVLDQNKISGPNKAG